MKDHQNAEISTATASLWLHDMGFSYKQFSKGVYFDGHERDDVVRARELYLEKLMSYSHRMWTSHSPAPNPSYSPVIRIFHDESTFYANADQSFHWTDGTKQVQCFQLREATRCGFDNNINFTATIEQARYT